MSAQYAGVSTGATMPDGIALAEWVGDRLPGTGPFVSRRIGDAGVANLLYVIGRDGHEWVLRRPPTVKNDPSAGDTSREWRILTALEGTAVPHPSPRLWCDDPAIPTAGGQCHAGPGG